MFIKRFPITDPHKKTLVLIHGLGEHSGRYGEIINWFNEKGFEVITFDLPGHGLSEGKRGDIPDFYEIYTFIEEISPDKFYLFGHSLGGLIALRYTQISSKKPEKLILSAPAVGNIMKKKDIFLLKLVWFFDSMVFKNGIDPRDLAYNNEEISKYINDPLVHNKITVRTAKQIYKESISALNMLKSLTDVLILLLYGSEDKIVQKGCEEFESISSDMSNIKVVKIIGAKHEIFRDSDYKTKFFKAIKDFIT